MALRPTSPWSEYAETEGAAPFISQKRRKHHLNRNRRPQKGKGPKNSTQPFQGQPTKTSGKQAVGHKPWMGTQTTTPIPFQRVDWPTRSQYLKRLTALRIERSSWIRHWQDLSAYVLPRQSRFNSTDKDLGYRKDRLIINSRATRDLHTMAAGMMSGITSPARPWFKLAMRDPDLSKFGPVREWLQDVEDLLRITFAKSNFYDTLHTMYGHLALFGTAVAVLEEDDRDVIRLYVQPIGAYGLAQSGTCRIDTLYREISLTVGQLVSKFGLENCSNFVQWNHNKGNYDLWVYVVHAIEPNRQIDNTRWDARFGPTRSAWFELGAYSGSTGYDTSDSGYSGEPLNFLRESGYPEFPVLAPRWQTTGMEDIYGESPYMECLGDIKALQAYEEAKAEYIGKLINPPMKGPASLKTGRASLVAGDVTYVDSSAKGDTFSPAITVPPEGLNAVVQAIKEHELRIDDSTLASVWAMFQGSIDDPKKTATEIQALKEEKLQVLGPLLERLHGELLSPAISRTFKILFRAGRIPKAPPEIAGQDLSVEYISTAAQAQRAIGVQAAQTLVSFTAQLAEIRPDAADNLDPDAIIEDFNDKAGGKGSYLVPPEKLAALRAQKARAAARQADAEHAQAVSSTAKNLSQADTSGDNGLSRLLGGLGQAGVAA